MKKKLKIIKKLTLFFSLVIALSLGLKIARTPDLNAEIRSSALLSYDSTFNYRQTINDCGPFNTAAMVRILKNETVDSRVFAEGIKWRLPNGYTLPWGLEKQLKENEVEVTVPYLGFFSDEERMDYLRQVLSDGNPIIILGERDEYIGKNYEHYLTLVGFDRDEDLFYAYDPFFPASIPGVTQDANGEIPGNRTYKTDELLEFWGGGGMFGFYKWYALVGQ